jgi:trimeric autotransporter adhesin
MKIRTTFLPFPGCGMAAAGLLFSFLSLFGAVPGDEHWDAQFGWPGPGGFVLAVTSHNGRLYVSGTGVSNTNKTVQVWDGAQWSSIGQFQGPPTTMIYDLAFVGDTLYAGGIFTNVDGAAASCLAKWDGQAWSAVSLNGAVYALAVDGANLYAAGYFTTNAAGQPLKRIGCWNGSAWSALGDGLGTNYDQVWALAVTNGLVYAGGFFTNA